MLRIFLVCVLFITPMKVSANDDMAMTEALRALFLSADNRHREAAEVFAQLGQALQSTDLMREASQEALRAKLPEQALLYARQWENFGGGALALRQQAAILLWQERYRRAELIMAKLAEQKADDVLFNLLSGAPDKKQAAAIGHRLLSQMAVGQLFLARLAIAAGEWSLARDAIAQGLKHRERQAIFYLLRARLAAFAAKQPAAALVPLEEYLAAGCAGWANDCGEAALIHAYRLFSEGNANWRQPLQNPAAVEWESALQAGQFFESIEMPARALGHYEKVSSRFFQARLGLARIARDGGDLQQALDILNNSAVTNDHEFILRETTVAHLLEELEGAEAAYARIAAARRTSPENPTLLYNQSLFAESAGDIDGALDLLREMTRLHPRRADGWNALGYVMADHNRNLAEAEKYIKRALVIDGDDPNILDSMGWVLYRRGKALQALTFLQRAAEGSDAAEIAAHLGEVYWALGNKEKARRVLKAAVLRKPDNKILNDTIKRLGI